MDNRIKVKVNEEYWARAMQILDRYNPNFELFCDSHITKKDWSLRRELDEIAQITGFKTVYQFEKRDALYIDIVEKEVGILERPIFLRLKNHYSHFNTFEEAKECKLEILNGRLEEQKERVNEREKEYLRAKTRLEILESEIKKTKGFGGTFKELRKKKCLK